MMVVLLTYTCIMVKQLSMFLYLIHMNKQVRYYIKILIQQLQYVATLPVHRCNKFSIPHWSGQKCVGEEGGVAGVLDGYQSLYNCV